MKAARPILILDDEHHVTRSLAYLLENNGFICITQNDSRALAELMEKSRPGVVILDINMPEMDGYQICRQIRANKDYDDVAIIFLSGRNRQEDIDKAFDAGANEFFVKPFSPIELRDKIKSICGVA